MSSGWQTTFCVGVLCLAAALASAARPTVIRSLRLVGNPSLQSSEIESRIRSRAGVAYDYRTLQDDLRRISAEYVRQGYWHAEARVNKISFSPDSAGVDIEISVTEGRPVLVAGISVVGLFHLASDEVLSQFGTRIGAPFHQAMLESDIGDLLKDLELVGRPFAECTIASSSLRDGQEADSITIVVEVKEGDSLAIDEVRIEGAHETDPAYILRESRLKRGETYSPDRVNAVRSRLNRLNIFSSVAEPELYIRNGKGGILITVQEGNTNTFDGVVGYQPAATPTEKGYFTGLVSLAMRNLFGTGRKLAFRWERENSLSQELAVRYSEPWFLGLPLSIGGGFLQRQQDTAYVRRALDLRADLLVTDRFTVGLVAGSESTIPSADTTVRRAYRSSALTIGADLAYDSRDDAISPTEGIRYHADYHYGRKSVPGALSEGKVSLQRVGLDLELYLSPIRRQVIALGLHGRQVEGGELQEGELYRFGGTTTLRGYRENQFLGSRIGWANLEYRFLVGRRTFFYGFVDGGYYFRPESSTLGLEGAEVFKYGTGLGVRLETGLGNMGVSFALGEGDSFSTAKIHVGLLSDF